MLLIDPETITALYALPVLILIAGTFIYFHLRSERKLVEEYEEEYTDSDKN